MAIQLIKDLDFASKINACEAMTDSGSKMLSRYRGYCYTNSATCALVNNFISEARSGYSFDDSIMSVVESIEKYITENKTRWQLASVSEGIRANSSAYNALNRKSMSKVDKLVEMNENDVRAYIKAGVLKDIQFIPEVRAVCRSVYGKQANECKSTLAYSVSTPVSYVALNEDGSKTFMVNGVAYRVNEDMEITVGDATTDTALQADFARVNSLLAGMRAVGEGLEYVYETGIGEKRENKFTVTEDKISFTNGRYSESFNDVAKFREFVFSDSFAKALNIREAQKFARIGQSVADVYEHIGNVCALDNVKLLTCSTGAVIAVTESGKEVNVTLFNSFGKINESKTYALMKDAVTEMRNKYGIDTETLFAQRIASDIKSGSSDKIDESDEKNVRLLKIAELSECFKDDPVKLMILKEMAAELSVMK